MLDDIIPFTRPTVSEIKENYATAYSVMLVLMRWVSRKPSLAVLSQVLLQLNSFSGSFRMSDWWTRELRK